MPTKSIGAIAGPALFAALMLAAPAAGAAPCPSLAGELDALGTEVRVDELETLLSREGRRLAIYRAGWPSVFGVAAVGQVALAGLIDETRRPSLYVSAFKAALGATVTPFLSPRLSPLDPPGGPPCARLQALEAELVRLARRERRGVAWHNHALGWALNVAGLLYLGLVEDQWLEGAAGALVGISVGELRLWSQPRGAVRALEGAAEDRGPWISVGAGGLTVRF